MSAVRAVMPLLERLIGVAHGMSSSGWRLHHPTTTSASGSTSWRLCGSIRHPLSTVAGGCVSGRVAAGAHMGNPWSRFLIAGRVLVRSLPLRVSPGRQRCRPMT